MRAKLIVVSVAAAAAALTAIVTLSGPAHAGEQKHKLHFGTKTVEDLKLGNHDFVTTAHLFRRHLGRFGTRSGTAVFTCVPGSSVAVVKCSGTLALKAGSLFTTETVSFSKNTLVGTVDGGTGIYAGATGKIKGVGGGNNHSLVTAIYTQ